jgi:hypothetical protein
MLIIHDKVVLEQLASSKNDMEQKITFFFSSVNESVEPCINDVDMLYNDMCEPPVPPQVGNQNRWLLVVQRLTHPYEF